MIWSGSSSSSVWEAASKEDDSHSGLAGLDPDGRASSPPMVGTPLRGGMAFTAAAVTWCPCILRASEYLSQAFQKASGSISGFFLAASKVVS